MKKIEMEYLSRISALLSGACITLLVLTVIDNVLGLGMLGFKQLNEGQKITIYCIVLVGVGVTMLYPFVPLFYKNLPRLDAKKHCLYLALGVILACMIAQGNETIVTSDKVIIAMLETIAIITIGYRVYKDLDELPKTVIEG